MKIEENIEVLGDANFYSDFRLKTLQEAGSPLRMVLIDSTGKLEDLNKRGFLEYLYQIENCVVDENGDYYPPVWNNKPGVLYTTPILGCPPHKVGIGTSNPIAQLDVKENVAIGFDDVTPILKYPNTYPVNYKLAVNGKIISTGLKIENVVNWSDFVFDSVYVLQPLKSVEDYLLEYKHLPNIPSAKEVEENGYEVQEMDALLLEKIEQLFLYVIELEKQNTILQQKVAELEGN